MLKKCLIGLFALLLCSGLYAQIPKFSDYPAQVYKGKNAPLLLNSQTANFKTRFRALAKTKPNYAGHYVVDFFGCGAGCVSGIVFNVKTGQTQFLPFGGLMGCYKNDEYIDQDFDFDVKSKLFVTYGQTESDNQCQTRYYVENNGKIELLKSKK